MQIHDQWDLVSFDGEAVAPGTGPFPRRPFLESWWRTRSRTGESLALVESADALLSLVVDEDQLRFCGEADLTDYHSPLGPGASRAVQHLASAFSGHGFSFDSMPREAAKAVVSGLRAGGVEAEVDQTDQAFVLPLPGSTETWLAGLGKKHRHELRRKRRRFSTELGEPIVERRTDAAAIDEFVERHRQSTGPKGGFMTPQRAVFFRDLVDRAGAVLDALIARDRIAAWAFGFEHGDGYYLYNMALDPETRSASPGIVLVGSLIDDQIARGSVVFDFLKGDEGYKHRLGARPRPLFTVSGRFP